MYLNQEVILAVLIAGTLFTYLFNPTPNVLYKDDVTKNDILNFESNSGCFNMKTQEVACPCSHHE